MRMKKIVWGVLISLIAGFMNACSSTDESKPFVGRWDFWQDNCYYELELSLYDALSDGSYGRYSDYYDDTTVEYRIVNVSAINGNEAEVTVDGFSGEQKAIVKFDSENISFCVSDMEPVVFKKQDKYGYVLLSGTDKINVLSAPVSGTTLLVADRGQSFRFLDIEQGWFKVELSDKDKQVGYVSPEHAFYLKDNRIPDEALDKSYSNGPVSIMFERKGEQILMVKETMRPTQDGSFLPAIIESYLGNIEGNAIVFTYFQGGYADTPDPASMSEIEPYVVYYWKESGVFIMEGENYSPF